MPPRSPIEFTDETSKRVGNKVQIDQISANLTSSNMLPVYFGDSASVDSFQRLRVSEPISRFDAQLTYDLQPLLLEQITAGANATIAHNATNRAAVMTFANTPTGGQAYMQSYRWNYYHPGNSQQIFITFNFKEHTPNVLKFAGYSDLENNGIRLISNGSTFAWQVLSNTSNGNQLVPQSRWNVDKLDGTGSSGYVLDVTKTHIVVIDLQALYVGRVRVGFDIDGEFILCHEFSHANRVANPYIQIATLPIIAGMTCTGTVSTTMEYYCASVRSEGAPLSEEGFEFSAEGTVTAASGARTHILSVRPNTTFNSIENRINFVLEEVSLLVTGNNSVLWELCVGQALTNPNWTDVNATYSGFEYDTTGTLNGNPAIVIHKGYAAATAQTEDSVSTGVSTRYPITLDAAGVNRTLGTLSLLVTGIGGTSATRASFNWREIR